LCVLRKEPAVYHLANGCVFSERNLLCITLLAPGILRRVLPFWKICAFLV